MAIATVVTRGYGNGTFSGTIPLVTLRGYEIGTVVDIWTVQTPDTTSWSDQTADTTIWTDQTPDSSVWTDQ